MHFKSTQELEEMLEKTHPSKISEFIEENREELLDGKREFMSYMKQKLIDKGLNKQDVFLNADIPMKYGYQLLSEEKHTKRRDVILRICYAAEFTLQETQDALKLYRMDKLYARDSRDALLMTFFNERPGSILDLNRLLQDEGMEVLRSCGTQD